MILIRIQKFVYLYPRTRSRAHTRDSWHAGLVPVPIYPWCQCTCTCSHGPRPRYTQDHIYSTDKVSKKTVILPHFFVWLFLVLDAGENFWNLDKKIEYLWWNILIYKDKNRHSILLPLSLSLIFNTTLFFLFPSLIKHCASTSPPPPFFNLRHISYRAIMDGPFPSQIANRLGRWNSASPYVVHVYNSSQCTTPSLPDFFSTTKAAMHGIYPWLTVVPVLLTHKQIGTQAVRFYFSLTGVKGLMEGLNKLCFMSMSIYPSMHGLSSISASCQVQAQN